MSLVFLDTETLGLGLDAPIWEIAAIRREDDPVFANWDQDQTALLERYWESEPAVVAVEIGAAGPRAADAFDAVADAEWARPGMRSNGSRFTLESLGVYFLHDVHHHLWDVQG